MVDSVSAPPREPAPAVPPPRGAGRLPLPSRTCVVVVALVLLAVLGGYLLLRTDSGAARPNIVLVVWDTARADRLSAYGHARPTSPLLEDFARDAVLFRNAFAPSPWTPPSHASLFTGLVPTRHGLTQGSGEGARVHHGIPLLAETLSLSGYETVGFTCNPSLSPATGLDAGFGRMAPVYAPGAARGSSEAVLRAVSEWLEGRRAPAGTSPRNGRPLFLFFNLMETHLPRSPSSASLAAVRDPAVDEAFLATALKISEGDAMAHQLGIRILDDSTLAAARMVYDASCRDLDEATGRILGALRAGGILEGALVAVTSDHGEALGEHGELGHRMSLRDTLLRIPLVVRWPGRLEGGRVEEAQVRLQDLYPTILEAAGAPVPPGTGVDSSSLLAPRAAGRHLRAEYHRAEVPSSRIRTLYPGASPAALERFLLTLVAEQDPVGSPGARKYLRYLRVEDDGRSRLHAESLFDLAADPGEERDLLERGEPEAEREALARLRAAADSVR